MLGTPSLIATVLGSAPAATADTAQLKSFARAAIDAGLYLLLIEPGGKKPVDMRSAVQKRTEDGKAQDAARAEGRADWDRVKSKAGVYLSTNDTTLIARYIDRYRKTYGEDTAINFAIDVGRSKLVVVDCDTADQVTAFLDDFGVPHAVPPTVKSPGVVDDNGTWVHKDGGHYYFTVDHPLPDYSGSLTAPGGYVILWANRYVLIPPSVRKEGAYRLVGQDFPAPPKLLDMVNGAVSQRTQRRMDAIGSADLTDAVNLWAAQISWDDILSPAGWSLTARQDQCGCDIWTAPGEHASPKSATAHDVECSLGRYTVDNAPLHIWTDNPGPELEAWMSEHGGKTLSRLQAVAVLEYGGHVGEAMRQLNVTPDASGTLGFGKDLAHELGTSTQNLNTPLPDTPVSADPFGSPSNDAGTEEDETQESDTPGILGVPNIQPFDYWRDFPAPEFCVEGILEHRSFAALIGAPGIGKSGVALDMACAIATGTRWMGRKTMRQRVLYLPGEGLSGAVQRIKAWESAHGLDVGSDLFVGDSIIQVAASPEAWSEVILKIMEAEIGLVIIDTFARASVGLEENSATDVGKAIARFDQVRKATGAGLLVVHHTKKGADSGRGSSALQGALDTELLVEHGNWWGDDECPGRQLLLRVTKQKNAAQPEDGIPMLAVSHGDSFVMTGPSGIVGDPLDTVAVPRTIMPESIVSVAIRLKKEAEKYTAQGLTRAELAYGVAMDDHTAGRKDPKKAWRMKINEAVDLGLRYGLLETLTGTATGARYVPGTASVETAHKKWSEEGSPE